MKEVGSQIHATQAEAAGFGRKIEVVTVHGQAIPD